MPLQFSENRRSGSINFAANSRTTVTTPGLLEASQAEAEEGVILGRYMSPLRTAQFLGNRIADAIDSGELPATFTDVTIATPTGNTIPLTITSSATEHLNTMVPGISITMTPLGAGNNFSADTGIRIINTKQNWNDAGLVQPGGVGGIYAQVVTGGADADSNILQGDIYTAGSSFISAIEMIAIQTSADGLTQTKGVNITAGIMNPSGSGGSNGIGYTTQALISDVTYGFLARNDSGTFTNPFAFSTGAALAWKVTDTGTTRATGGSTSNVAYGIIGDDNTGIYSGSSDTLGIVAGGVERIAAGSAVTVTGDLNNIAAQGGGVKPTDGTVSGILGPSALLTNSLAIGTTTNHPLALVHNSNLVGNLGNGALTLGVSGTRIGTLLLAGNTSGTATITPQAAAGTPTLTLPNASGTFAVSASSPLSLNTTTGALTITGAALTKSDDTNVTLTLGGSASTSLVNAASLTLGWTGQLALSRGGTAANLTASNGGIVYSTGSAMAILAGTATAGQILRSGSSTTPSWSTATYPATAGTAGNVLRSDGTNFLSAALAGSDVTGAALTKTDDTNVTLTLGGTPATALLRAASLTLGWTGTLAVSRGGTGISSFGTGVATALGVNIGSAGAFVTFNGALGTPSSGTLSNATGLPVSTGISGLGTGVAAFLATPSSANLATAVTDETGSSLLVFNTSPTLITPAITTSATLTNNLAANTSGVGLTLQNTTAATSGNQRYSPSIILQGDGWKTDATAASQTTQWRIDNQPQQGTSSPSTHLVFSSQINGGGYTPTFVVRPGGDAYFRINGTGTAQLLLDPNSGGGSVGVHFVDATQYIFGSLSAVPVKIYTSNTERARVHDSGGFSVNTTSDPGAGMIYTNSASFMIRTKTSYSNGAAAAAGTITNAPAVGNPTKWIPVDDNGTTRYIPAW